MPALLLMSQEYMARRDLLRFEYPVLIALATCWMMIMVSGGDLMALYIGLELQSLSLYVIASLRRDSVKIHRSRAQVFPFLGASSSGLLLYGASPPNVLRGHDALYPASWKRRAPELSARAATSGDWCSSPRGIAFKVSAAPVPHVERPMSTKGDTHSR